MDPNPADLLIFVIPTVRRGIQLNIKGFLIVTDGLAHKSFGIPANLAQAEQIVRENPEMFQAPFLLGRIPREYRWE